MDISKIKQSIDLMHATGSDDSQYLLIRMKEIEELIVAYERDQILQEWLRKIVNALEMEVDNERSTEEDESRETEESGNSAKEGGTEGNPEEPEDGEMDHERDKETGTTERA